MTEAPIYFVVGPSGVYHDDGRGRQLSWLTPAEAEECVCILTSFQITAHLIMDDDC